MASRCGIRSLDAIFCTSSCFGPGGLQEIRELHRGCAAELHGGTGDQCGEQAESEPSQLLLVQFARHRPGKAPAGEKLRPLGAECQQFNSGVSISFSWLWPVSSS